VAADAAPPPPAKPAENKGSVTNLPLPRWAALRADDVNLRVGPGMNFPIEWQYHRRDLPVQILRELEVWRLIEDQDGVKGWVHSATLTGRRSFVIKSLEATLRAAAADEAAPVARLKPGVVGRIRACAAGAAWCEVQVADYRGWLRRDEFFGTDPGEAVGN
jgi:SH3-like domain-containing protein